MKTMTKSIRAKLALLPLNMEDDNVRTEIIIITPELAKQLLLRNKRNRNVHERTVEQYSKIMSEGKWRENYDPIQISDGGVLLNGQHRLKAIIKSNKPQRMLIIWGVKDNARDSYDRGKTRTIGDILSLDNIPNSKYVASILKAYNTLKKGNVMSVSNGKMNGSSNKSIGMIDSDYIEMYNKLGSRIQDSLSDAISITKKLKGMFTISELAGYILYLSVDKKHSYDKVITFFNNLHQLDYSLDKIINMLRERLVSTKMSGYKMSGKTKKALIVKSWNAYVENKDIKRLIWNESRDVMPDFI